MQRSHELAMSDEAGKHRLELAKAEEAKQILDTATFGLFFNGLFVSVFA